MRNVYVSTALGVSTEPLSAKVVRYAKYASANTTLQSVAEKTRFGWTIMTSGAEEVDVGKIFLTQTSATDYDELCRLDVLELEDSPTGDQETVYAEFREQLKHSNEGWYETGFPWKGNHPPLPSNEKGSLRRLNTLVHKLEKSNLLNSYDAII